MVKILKTITESEYNKMSDAYKGVYSDYQGILPHLKGKRSIITLDPETGGTVLIIEGHGLEIIEG